MDFIRPKDLARSADRVIFRMVEIVDIVNVSANFRREEFRIERCLGAGAAVQPTPVCEGKWFGFNRFALHRSLLSASLSGHWRGTQELLRFERGLVRLSSTSGLLL